MPYTITFLEQNGYLRVEMRGNRNTGDPARSGRSAVDQIVEKCRESGYTRILIISHLTGDYPPFANYQVVSAMAQEAIPEEWKMAYINLDPNSHKAVQFSETMATRKGVQARLFDNEQDAIDWLNSSNARTATNGIGPV